MNLEEKLRSADRGAVALALPEGTALVEFVRFWAFNFEAIPSRGDAEWRKPRFMAFVIRSGEPDDVGMVDLGEADHIEQMIANFRTEITGEAESQGGRLAGGTASVRRSARGSELRASVFDPIEAFLGSICLASRHFF
jgi:hypothetical protein